MFFYLRIVHSGEVLVCCWYEWIQGVEIHLQESCRSSTSSVDRIVGWNQSEYGIWTAFAKLAKISSHKIFEMCIFAKFAKICSRETCAK